MIGPVAIRLRAAYGRARFPGSTRYWEQRYQHGDSSGPGSYGELASFKAQTLNRFTADHHIVSVIEFGCGDGNQLSYASYPRYIGLDVSQTAVRMCANRFAQDRTKSFFLYDPESFVDNGDVFRANLALSLDVLFHLVEDAVFEQYLRHLFAAADRFVIIYSSDLAGRPGAPHMRHRTFTTWVAANIPGWTLVDHIPGLRPFRGDIAHESLSEFYVYASPTEIAPPST